MLSAKRDITNYYQKKSPLDLQTISLLGFFFFFGKNNDIFLIGNWIVFLTFEWTEPQRITPVSATTKLINNNHHLYV